MSSSAIIWYGPEHRRPDRGDRHTRVGVAWAFGVSVMSWGTTRPRCFEATFSFGTHRWSFGRTLREDEPERPPGPPRPPGFPADHRPVA